MNKLHTLCALILLTACGGSPPVWDGEWQRIDDDRMSLTIRGFDLISETNKNVYWLWRGRIDAKCRFNNAQESEVQLECEGEDPMPMAIKGDKIFLTEPYDDEVWTFVRIW